jgi:hypothetical protein
MEILFSLSIPEYIFYLIVTFLSLSGTAVHAQTFPHTQNKDFTVTMPSINTTLLYVADVITHVLSQIMRAMTFSRYVICACDNRWQNSLLVMSFPATYSRIDVV